ncbi:MAG: NTP transferase domain-containing protein [Anaerolineae bacterium]|nr:NTP transferase domain-containing protein [Anaerolineae bacterium]
MPSRKGILGVIMGGGRGSRLFPLTRDRAKPAVPIAGKYRLIDIPISNCINSGIHRIAVLTQFNSVSLHRHITQTYNFDSFHHGWVQIWAAEQTINKQEGWYQGTADAVRKQLVEIQSTGAEHVIILAGDHIYRMNYDEMLQYHQEKGAEITVAVQPVSTEQVPHLGILKRGPEGMISDFAEKPKDAKTQEFFVSRDDPKQPFLGSMGIYLFNTQSLVDVLRETSDDDFGGEVIPKAIRTHRVAGFDFNDYWEDIGTVRSFFETNLALASPESPFLFQDRDHPIYSRPRYLPGTRVDGATLENVLLADGCLIGKANIGCAVIGLRSKIQDGVILRKTVLMGADYFDPVGQPPEHGIALGIGANCNIEGALIDKNARLGEGISIRPFARGTEIEGSLWCVRDGIVVIPKNTVLAPGTVIGPT